ARTRRLGRARRGTRADAALVPEPLLASGTGPGRDRLLARFRARPRPRRARPRPGYASTRTGSHDVARPGRRPCPRSGPVEGVWGNREVPPEVKTAVRARPRSEMPFPCRRRTRRRSLEAYAALGRSEPHGHTGAHPTDREVGLHS